MIFCWGFYFSRATSPVFQMKRSLNCASFSTKNMSHDTMNIDIVTHLISFVNHFVKEICKFFKKN